MSTGMTKKKYLGALIAFLLILVFAFLPGSATEGGMSHEAFTALGIFLAALVLWMLDVMPMGIVGCLCMILLPLLKAQSLPETIGSFSTASVLFIVGTFGITAAMKNSTIPQRITNFVVRVAKGKTKTIIMLLTIATGLISSFMSSSATMIMFWSFSSALLVALGVSADQNSELKSFGKALAISAPVAAGTGGFITPAGTPGNIIIMGLLEQMGYPITFAQWTIIAAPLGIVALIIIGFFLGRVFKSPNLTREQMDKLEKETGNLPPLTRNEILTIVIIAAMIVMWFLGSWITILNVAVVAILGLSLFFLCDVLDMKKFAPECNLNTVLLMGTAPAIAATLASTGALAVIVTGVFSGAVFQSMNGIILLVLVSLILMILRAFMPTPAAFASLFIPLMATIAGLTGGNPFLLFMVASFWGPTDMLLIYTEPIFLPTYAEGYYTEKDLLKFGIIPSVILAVLVAVLVSPLCSIAGLI